MLYIRSSDFIRLIVESLYAFNNFSLFPYHPAPGNYYSAFCVYEFDFLIKFYIWSRKKKTHFNSTLKKTIRNKCFHIYENLFFFIVDLKYQYAGRLSKSKEPAQLMQ